MTEHETWTAPPGFRISDGAGGSKDPLAGIQVTSPITISSTELLDLDTTLKVLVSAPAANRLIVPLAAVAVGPPIQTPYTTAGAVLSIGWGDQLVGKGGLVTLPPGLLGEATGPNVSIKLANAIDDAPGTGVGLPLTILSTGPLTDGNGALVVVVVYLVVQL